MDQPRESSGNGSVLAGKRVLVTRSRAQASKLAAALRDSGAVPVEFPTIQILPPEDGYAALDAEIAALHRFDWTIFTSTNAVRAFRARLEAAAIERLPETLRVAAIGTATIEALEQAGLRVDMVPERFVGEALLAALVDSGIAGRWLLLPRADIARETLPAGLVEAGAQVSTPIAYRTAPARPDPEALATLEEGVDIITFTSGSTVRNFVEQLGIERVRHLAARATIAAIGPVTAGTARELGLAVDLVAETHTIPGLVTAIRRYYEKGNPPQ